MCCKVRRFALVVTLTAVTVSLAGCCVFGPCPASSSAKSPKNVIVMIADGCGFNQVDAASYYQHGESGQQVYEQFPVKLAMSTYAAGQTYDPDQAWRYFNYVEGGGYTRCTDSAAAGTAMATGQKTYKGAIGVSLDKKPLQNILQAAETTGRSTGVVTSVEFSHATPAGFAAHNESRNNYAQIAREIIYESPLEVVMGCGHPLYDNNGAMADEPRYDYVGGEDTWNDIADGKIIGADANGDNDPDEWTFIDSREQFRQLTTGAAPSRLLGVPRMHQSLQFNRSGAEQKQPFEKSLNDSVPDLATMVRAAINVLDEDPEGFYVMIEGGAVDWAGHANNLPRNIEEMVDFNKAVEAVVEWVETNSSWDETLLIVTADHETGYLTGPDSGATERGVVWNPIVNNGKGNLPGGEWHTGGHTNSLVPFYAKGSQSSRFNSRAKNEDPVHGSFIDNTDIANTLRAMLAR